MNSSNIIPMKYEIFFTLSSKEKTFDLLRNSIALFIN
jgi:hypothetical protein